MFINDVLGFRSYDNEPAFQEVEGGFYYHLKTKRLFAKDEFDAKLVAEGKTFQVGEVGYASAKYVWLNGDMLHSFVPPPGSAQMNVNVTTAPTATPDSTGVITVVGGPTDEPLLVIIWTQDSTSAEPTETRLWVNMQEQETADEVAARIAAAAYDANLSGVAAVGPAVTFTPSLGGTITMFTADTDRPY